jgi:hypothetical protein
LSLADRDTAGSSFDVLVEVVAADEEGEAVGAELGDVHALVAGIPAAEDAEVLLHLRPHLLPGRGSWGNLASSSLTSSMAAQ